MPDPTIPSNTPETPQAGTFAVPRALFDIVPQRRSRYIIAYLVYIAAVFGPRILSLAGIRMPDTVVYAGYGLGLIAFAIFAYNFFRTMRVMGYERWFAGALALICAPLLPGFLLLAYLDRRIATAWYAADPSGGYRQKPPTNDPE